MFYMYQTSQFMEHAQKHLNRRVEPESIDEIRKLSDTRLTKNIEESDAELAERIAPKHKAIRRFVSNHTAIRRVLSAYKEYGLSTYEVDGNPSSLPTQLLDELEPIIREDGDVVTAMQAVHSLAPAVFERHTRRTGITGEVLNDAYLTNNLPGAFIRLLDTLRSELHMQDPTAELKVYLREQYLAEENDPTKE